jgi:RimJ/RimL family protein N-acetyltransferase
MVNGRAVDLTDDAAIERFLRRDVHLNIYQIGDLDDFFRPYTVWHGWMDGDELLAVVLIYNGLARPTLLALSQPHDRNLTRLLNEIGDKLPDDFYAHLTEGAEAALSDDFEITSDSRNLKMALLEPSLLEGIDTSAAVRLTTEDKDELTDFYKISYPEGWFDSRMLETGMTFGIRDSESLVSVAGIHVYSQSRRVAALGNIATRPDRRGRGLAAAVTARLCRELRRHVDYIGLNVKGDNIAAVACYERLGFRRVANYFEYGMKRKVKV